MILYKVKVLLKVTQKKSNWLGILTTSKVVNRNDFISKFKKIKYFYCVQELCM